MVDVPTRSDAGDGIARAQNVPGKKYIIVPLNPGTKILNVVSRGKVAQSSRIVAHHHLIDGVCLNGATGNIGDH